jgi:spoIIIJ-associated protein
MSRGVSLIKIESFVKDLIRDSGLDLTYKVVPAAIEFPQQIVIEFSGPDSRMLAARNGELLLAFEHLAAEALRLEPEEYDLISFEAGGFKAERARSLKRIAEIAVLHVRGTGTPYAFAPMSLHERRLLHLALAPSGLFTQSEGEGARRHIVLYAGPPAKP